MRSLFLKEPTLEKEISKKKVLFIVKQRSLPYYDQIGTQVSTGLLTSSRFVVNQLQLTDPSIEVKLVDVIDNNCIDREVTLFKPDIVIIEALWVVPDKFDALKKLHKHVDWVVRLHSDIPFIAGEGIAFEWITEYIKRGITIACNNLRITKELGYIYGTAPIVYLPNCFTVSENYVTRKCDINKVINIGCFGAIRPLKNQLLQAVCAIKFANAHGWQLRFHINGNRCEGKGEPILRNLRGLFALNDGHYLVEHTWMPHDEFSILVQHMDICMQFSLSETFNIVTADAVNAGVPVAVSNEIDWVHEKFRGEPTSSDAIILALENAYMYGGQSKHRINAINLQKYNATSVALWRKFIGVCK
jgi:hypothetical protein